jgi:arabinoxylan arabinofuranohydrolase
MKRRSVTPFLVAFYLIATVTGYAQNPIVQTIYTADPAPLVYKDTLFLYTGHDEDGATWFTMKDWQLFATTDMVNWVHRGSPLSLKDFAWADKDAWAGHCIERNGKFYWYVPVNQKGGGMTIGVAVADHPAGPFRDALGKPLIAGGWGYIDPAVFIDDNGQAYLYWGNPHLYYVKLNADMVSFDQATGIVKVPLTEASFKLRIIDAGKTFSWAASIDGLASHAIKNNKDGKHYWYVSAIDQQTGKKVIGVAVGEKAIGLYRDALGKPLVTNNCDSGNINPTVITDDLQQQWLTWGTDELYYAKLKEDMISFHDDTGPVQIPAEKKNWFARKINGTMNSTEKRFTTYEEGPWLYKRHQLYYLFYPAGGVPEHLAYSTASSATGPWTYQDTVMAVIGKGGAFTNHPGVVDYKGNTYLFYHNGALAGGGGFTRSVCVDEMQFNANGTVQRVAPTKGIGKAVGKLDPFSRVEAETIAWEEGIETAHDPVTGIFVTAIEEADYIKIRNVDCKNGAASFEASVACGTDGGKIEIRTGSADGKLIGTCPVPNTGGERRWKTISCKIENAKGIQDLCLVFRGNGQSLFNFDWWKFSRR